jgi:hypothetical protein
MLHTTDLMGFVRLPELDFHPGEGITVKAYRLDLTGRASTGPCHAGA